MNLLIPFYALIAPFIVWPIEYVLPYPFVIEEIAKAVIVYLIPAATSKKQGIKLALLIGLLFGLTETVIYIFNILSGGTVSFWGRILLTVPMHTLTPLVVYLTSYKNKKLIVVGAFLAIIIHYLFNLLIKQV